MARRHGSRQLAVCASRGPPAPNLTRTVPAMRPCPCTHPSHMSPAKCIRGRGTVLRPRPAFLPFTSTAPLPLPLPSPPPQTSPTPAPSSPVPSFPHLNTTSFASHSNAAPCPHCPSHHERLIPELCVRPEHRLQQVLAQLGAARAAAAHCRAQRAVQQPLHVCEEAHGVRVQQPVQRDDVALLGKGAAGVEDVGHAPGIAWRRRRGGCRCGAGRRWCCACGSDHVPQRARLAILTLLQSSRLLASIATQRVCCSSGHAVPSMQFRACTHAFIKSAQAPARRAAG